MVVGRLIPAGTGLAYHEARRKQREEWDLSGEQVEAQLAEALGGSDDDDMDIAGLESGDSDTEVSGAES